MSTTRITVPLDGQWLFSYQPNEMKNKTLPDNLEYNATMIVPGYWDDYTHLLTHTDFWSRDLKLNPEYRRVTAPMGTGKPADTSLPFILGTGWYKRSFYVEADWADKCIMIEVGGVTLEAWVWVNGTYIGHHLGHLTPFSMDLSSATRAGEKNDIVIAVSNMRTDRIGCSIRGYKGKSAGITRLVQLTVTNVMNVQNSHIYFDEKDSLLHWETEIAGYHASKTVSVKWEVIDPHANTILADGVQQLLDTKCCWTTDDLGMQYWSDHNPRLYRIRLTLMQEEIPVDQTEQNFGLRSLHTDGFKLFLNKSPVFLRGLTDHAYFPETCTVPTDLDYYMKTLKLLKKMGFNWIRFHTWYPPEECLEAADELGMLLQVETANGFTEQEWLDMLYTCRKHPSVVIYCCGNEVRVEGEMLDHIEKMADHCHRLVPECLFNPMEGLRAVEYELDENDPGYVGGEYPYNKNLLKRLNQFSDVYAPHGSIFSYHSLSTTDDSTIENRLAVHDRPCLMHEAGINDSYLNLDLEHRYEKTRIGTDLFSETRRYLSEMCLLENAHIYYKNSCVWQRQTIKYSFENMRRSERISGYDFLGAIDCHWHRSGYAVGLLNEFYEPKSGLDLEKVVQFNGESVLLADVGVKRNLVFGQKLTIRLRASLFSGSTCSEGNLTWYLANSLGKVYCRGEKDVSNLSNGTIAELGEVRLTAPTLSRAEHLKLHARLRLDDLEIENSWDYWVFPEVTDQVSAVTVLNRLDKEALVRIENGERVLLLGAGSFPNLPTTYQIMSGGRSVGNNATVVYEHPILKGFPHDGLCDWQFYSMLEEGTTVVFNDLPIPFKPIIEVVSSYKFIRKQASLFELGIGSGGIVVCSLNLDPSDPGACYLKHLLMKYISSREFNPAVQISSSQMIEMMNQTNELEVDFSTDEAYDNGGHVQD